MPAKKYLYFNQNSEKSPGDLRIMPCSVIVSIAVVKAVNVHLTTLESSTSLR
jgi:hypothetical protein